MSDTDSFIEEVTEEVRKDKLFGYFKKYGWIAGAVVVLAVGGAAYSEWSKTKTEAAAQARGDAMDAALSLGTASEQIKALEQLTADSGNTRALIAIQKASILTEDGQKEAALEALNVVVNAADAPQVYRDMANLKSLILRGKDMDETIRMRLLEALATPGNTFRTIAMEQIAVTLLDADDRDGAVNQLTQVLNEPDLTSAMRQRVTQLLVSLGGDVPLQTQLLSGN